MLGRISRDQGQLFYSFNLEEIVPDDHLVRAIARILDLSWVRAELAPHYSYTGRPSIDPVLMIRMLIVGYVFAIRSERALCREVQLNLAYAGSVASALRTLFPTIRRSHAHATSASATAIFSATCSTQQEEFMEETQKVGTP
jgi:transposase